MVRKIQFNFTNKWFYTFALIIGIFALGVGVYATSHPNPGHTAIEIEGVCLSDGTNCLSGGGQWTASGSDIFYDTGGVGVGVTNPSAMLHVDGSFRLDDTETTLSNPEIKSYVPINVNGNVFYLQLYGEFVLAPPSAPSGMGATTISGVEIDLTWNDNSNNENNFELERSQTSASSGFSIIATPGAGATSYADIGLSLDTTYWYRIRACNSAGCSSYSNVASATTSSTPLP